MLPSGLKDTQLQNPDNELQQPTGRRLIGASFSTLAICCCFPALGPAADADGALILFFPTHAGGHEGYGSG